MVEKIKSILIKNNINEKNSIFIKIEKLAYALKDG